MLRNPAQKSEDILCSQVNIRLRSVPLIRLPNHAEILQKERETANLKRKQ